MADGETLLAYLVPRHARSVEDAATDGVVHLLKKSKSAASAFNAMLEASLGMIDHCIDFETQETKDNSRFDLVGYDQSRKRRVIGESKFWAALGKGQGSGYLSDLADDGISVLLFIVPGARINYLWREVQADIANGNETVLLEDVPAEGNVRCAVVNNSGKRLMMVSWRYILERMHNSSLDEPDVAAEIRQLLGLSNRMDSQAFLPLQSTELGPEFIRRLHQYQGLSIEVIEIGRTEGWITEVNTSTSRWPGGYGRFFQLSGNKAWFGLNGDLWSTQGDTPMWLMLEPISVEDFPVEAVQRYSLVPGRNDIPIYPLVGSDRDEVLAHMASQLKEIATAISGSMREI